MTAALARLPARPPAKAPSDPAGPTVWAVMSGEMGLRTMRIYAVITSGGKIIVAQGPFMGLGEINADWATWAEQWDREGRHDAILAEDVEAC